MKPPTPNPPWNPQTAEHTHQNGETHTHDYGQTPHAHQTITVSNQPHLARYCLNATGGLDTEPDPHPGYRYTWRPHDTENNQ